jgi:hypothetical protein
MKNHILHAVYGILVMIGLVGIASRAANMALAIQDDIRSGVSAMHESASNEQILIKK